MTHLPRRRFLTLTAAFACAPALAQAKPYRWEGRALGAEVSVALHGPEDMARRALTDVPRLLENIEQAFSLFRPTSELSRLNMMGQLRSPRALMRTLLARAGEAHRLTGGLFDPTVQPLWQALARGEDAGAARALVGWDRVRVSEDFVQLGFGQALTLNGIAQGFATDVMRLLLARHGARQALVNIGEYAAIGGPFTLGLEDPSAGHLGTRELNGGAIATSSPPAMDLNGAAHILGPRGEVPLWSTVSIEAPSATLADALSTAATMMPVEALKRLKARAGLTRITLVDKDGDLRTL